MLCFVYKAVSKPGTYVYLRDRDGLERLPRELASGLGALQFVMELELTPERRLPGTDATALRTNLVQRGFHLQMPPLERQPGES